MFALPGILVLLLFVYVRPQEFIPELKALPMLYLVFGLALFGFVIDLRLRKLKPEPTPQLPWVMLFFAWCLITLAVKMPEKIAHEAIPLAVAINLYLLIGHGVQSFRAFQWVGTTLLALVLVLSVVAVHQGLAPWGCHVLDTSNPEDLSVGVYDGRPCATETDCNENDPEPGADYLCERVGLFGTHSVGRGRVRYLGPLQDPNELSLALGIAIPFAFALFARKRTGTRGLLVAATLILVAVATVFTQSRGGQLVFISVLGAYFVRRYGIGGLVAGAVLGSPLLLLGGRSGAEAEASSMERLECWYEGISMFIGSPVFGVGAGNFVEHHFLTAHNSYVLAPAELGLPGMILWSIVMYLSVKIPIVALQRLQAERAPGPEADVARAWAMALTASLIGLLVGILFLSFCYHQVLWIYVGVSGGFYLAMRRHDPKYEVRFGWRDLSLVVVIDLTLIALIFVYTRLKV